MSKNYQTFKHKDTNVKAIIPNKDAERFIKKGYNPINENESFEEAEDEVKKQEEKEKKEQDLKTDPETYTEFINNLELAQDKDKEKEIVVNAARRAKQNIIPKLEERGYETDNTTLVNTFNLPKFFLTDEFYGPFSEEKFRLRVLFAVKHQLPKKDKAIFDTEDPSEKQKSALKILNKRRKVTFEKRRVVNSAFGLKENSAKLIQRDKESVFDYFDIDPKISKFSG